MSIRFDERERTLTLETWESCYQMQISPLGYLIHVYYGRRAEGPLGPLHPEKDVGFSPVPYELAEETRGWSLDTMPQEYSGSNSGDFRLSALCAVDRDGRRGADLHYVRHTIRQGKYALTGLPCARGNSYRAETLSVILEDRCLGFRVELLYGVYPELDIITRAVRVRNTSGAALRLEKVASCCLDLPFGDWDLLQLNGRWAMERSAQRAPLTGGIHTISSRRVASSHQHSPFAILCDRHATEDAGDCLGAMLVWSGSFRIDLEQDQMGATRVLLGIRDEGFSWTLQPGERFETPEVLLCFRHDGLNALSQRFHRFLREDLCRSAFSRAHRPVLLNNWEATYFDFDSEKILAIAREARDLGAELFVLDDGWFGHRNDDRSSLGDWTVNTKKLRGGLEPLIEGVHALGLQFGLWVEPEMISEDSELFRAHPDWAVHVPGKFPSVSRSQLALDLSREDVCDWLYETLAGLLERYDIQYIKWDFNRSLTDLYSPLLPPDRQGEQDYRITCGLYRVLERLTERFPQVLIEGCAGGGGRFDAGMLCYCPQIWCSDDTDPIERLQIQRGTGYAYPVSAMGAHISASPNHQTGRHTPIGTRATVAMAGGFGCELDPGKLDETEKAEIRAAIGRYAQWEELIREGDLYRLTELDDPRDFEAWAHVYRDKSACLMSLVVTHPRANARPLHLRLKGLDPAACYRVTAREFHGAALPDGVADLPESLSGAALMYAGLTLPRMLGDWPSVQIHLQRIDPDENDEPAES